MFLSRSISAHADIKISYLCLFLESLCYFISLKLSCLFTAGSIHMDNVFCRGTESSLFECSHNGFDNHNCIHSEDAGVVCSSKLPHCTYFELA